ncbi:MAG: aminotransferase class I/II-fold pyridoxal phosphate-dependent enzyme [Eubacteriales bacterium]
MKRNNVARSLENLIINKNLTLKDAMDKINQNHKGTVFVVDNQEKVIGTLTDGDIRRLLLSDYGLNTRIENHLMVDFKYIMFGEDIESVLQKLQVKYGKRIKIVPILDHNMRLVDCYESEAYTYVPISNPELQGNEFKYLVDAFLSTWISSTGEYITQFEEMFADYCNVKHGVAVSNGTVALHLAMLALDIGVGDEVIVPDITFAATINAVLYVGATPVIVDIEEEGWCINPIEIEKAITPKTKAIIPVHIYGQPCEMEQIMRIAKEHNLYVVEDCAQAHGATFQGKVIGSFGDIACFSFFGNKVITTGEGGMCLSNDSRLIEKIRLLKDHGMSKERKYYHTVVGYNYRMTNLQAAIGVAQLERIEQIHEMRYELEGRYRNGLLTSKRVELQKNNLSNRKKIVWLVTILVDDDKRDSCLSKLKEEGIDARQFFIPLSEMELYKEYTFSNRISKQIASRGISLPTTRDITDETINKIKDIIG